MTTYFRNPSRTIEHLSAARNLIAREENWCQGAFRQGDAFCILGAIGEVVDEPLESPDEYEEADGETYRPDIPRGDLPEEIWFLRRAIKRISPDAPGYIYVWNDEQGRTHAEVLRAFDIAMEMAAEELQSRAA